MQEVEKGRAHCRLRGEVRGMALRRALSRQPPVSFVGQAVGSPRRSIGAAAARPFSLASYAAASLCARSRASVSSINCSLARLVAAHLVPDRPSSAALRYCSQSASARAIISSSSASPMVCHLGLLSNRGPKSAARRQQGGGGMATAVACRKGGSVARDPVRLPHPADNVLGLFSQARGVRSRVNVA